VKSPPVPVTPAVRALRAAGIAFVPHVYTYVERGGTRHSAEALGVPEHSVVKTLCMEARGKGTAAEPLLVLMTAIARSRPVSSHGRLERGRSLPRVSPPSRSTRDTCRAA